MWSFIRHLENNLLAGWSQADRQLAVASCRGGRTLQDDAYVDKSTSKTHTCAQYTLTHALLHTVENSLRSNFKQKRKKNVCVF